MVLTIMLILVLALCGCENNADEEEKNTETEAPARDPLPRRGRLQPWHRGKERQAPRAG